MNGEHATRETIDHDEWQEHKESILASKTVGVHMGQKENPLAKSYQKDIASATRYYDLAQGLYFFFNLKLGYICYLAN